MASPKFKLTAAEGLALFDAFRDDVALADVVQALTGALGTERTAQIIARKKGIKLTKAEQRAAFFALMPLAKGETPQAKFMWALKIARPAFATKERFLEAVAAAQAEFDKLSAAIPEPSGIGPNATMPVVGAKFLSFWIPANGWMQNGEKRLVEYIDACGARGVNFGMEAASTRAEENAFMSEANLNEAIRLLKVAVERCRHWNILCLISVLNNNSHIQKYGTKFTYTFTSVWPRATRFLDALAELGPHGLLVQGCAETQTEDGKKWETECRKRLPNFAHVYNGSAGRPKTKPAGYAELAYHRAKVTDSCPAGCLDILDCGSSILQVHEGYAGKARPSVLTNAAMKAHAYGAKAIGDYAFKYADEPDIGALDALAEVARTINGESTPVSGGAATDEIDLSAAQWNGRDADVRAWPITTKLAVSVSGRKVVHSFDKLATWPEKGADGPVVANTIVVAKAADGKWHAASWEWIARNQGVKNMAEKTFGSHIKIDPLKNWEPRSGETFYVLVSGLCRSAVRNVSERSQATKVVWP